MIRTINLIAFASILASGCALSPAPQAQMAPPEKELAEQLHGAIWSDLFSNAFIGNGNELAALWYNAGSDRPKEPLLRIENLVCSKGSARVRCRFGLFREGGAATYLGEPAPDRLSCGATFHRSRSDGRWFIPRKPPGPDGGHTRITIKCEPRT